jgi:signal transduction histidine kinase
VTCGTLVLEVQDNGSGFNVDSPPSGEGLHSIRRRMKDLGGKAEWNTERGGTRFMATLPLRK